MRTALTATAANARLPLRTLTDRTVPSEFTSAVRSTSPRAPRSEYSGYLKRNGGRVARVGITCRESVACALRSCWCKGKRGLVVDGGEMEAAARMAGRSRTASGPADILLVAGDGVAPAARHGRSSVSNDCWLGSLRSNWRNHTAASRRRVGRQRLYGISELGALHE